MWVLIFPLFTILCLTIALARQPRSAVILFRLALAGSVVPFLLHLWLTVAGWGDPWPPVGLDAYALAGATGIAALLVVSWRLVPERMRVAAFLPAGVALFYGALAMPLFAGRAPALAPLDKRPLFLLAGFTAHATAMLNVATRRVRRRLRAPAPEAAPQI